MTKRSESGTAATLNDDQTVPSQLATGLLKIGMAIRHHAWAGGESANLSPTQGQILAALLHREDRVTRPGDLARDLAVSGATVSVALRTLHDKGLVKRHRDSSDARSVHLELTSAGRDLAHESLTWSDFLYTAASELNPEEQAVFQRSIVKMIRSMQQNGQIPPARMCVSCIFFRPNAHPNTTSPHHCAFVDAAFGDRQLRIDCGDFVPLSPSESDSTWREFTQT